ncbi:Hypothetical protein MVR_LOCUS314 [uncultured virus]|nr:Hypothetical protein MVR_LOCUS314 [uncultured virus]
MQVINTVNQYLTPISTSITKYAGLQTGMLPSFFSMPLVNTSIAISMLLLLMCGYTDSVFYSIGVAYPLIYGIWFYHTDADNSKTNHSYSKYWIVFGIIGLADATVGMLLSFIPGYSYAKIILVYSLVRDDFGLSFDAYHTVIQYGSMLSIKHLESSMASGIRVNAC